jgi:pimeloyl-ACP methyl ester carboxylesterase
MQRVQQAHADPARIDLEQAERQYRLFRRAGNRDAVRAILQAGGAFETEPLLGCIRAPTLLLWGAEDPLLPPSNAQRFGRDIDNAEVIMIPSAGHVPMLEQPESSVAELLDFLDERHGRWPADLRPTGRAAQPLQ